MPEDNNNIELRSEEIQEIIGTIPNWIIRWGITIILITITVLFIGSMFFKYPDVVNSSIVVTTENPPASIIARTNGKIDTIFVKNNQKVAENQILAIISNPADYKIILYLSNLLESVDIFNIDSNSYSFINSNLNLGEVQSDFSIFIKSLTDYYNFQEINFHKQKITAIKQQINATNEYIYDLIQQKKTLYNELLISNKQLERDSSLLNSEAISMADFEKTQSNYLQKKYSFQNAKTTISNTKIQISQLEQSILDLQLSYINEKKRLETELRKNHEILKSSIKKWEQNYVLTTPVSGQVIFTKIWSDNQNVISSDNVFNVVPQKQSYLTGRLQLPIEGSGKVEVNQVVNIKFSNYPYMEYGVVKGKIKSISPVPTENFYVVLVDFPDSLTTNYGKILPFTQEMSGTAEIITKNTSLLSRLFSPIKYIKEKFKRND